MKYRSFGKTGLKVSEIGFGCGRVGGLLLGDDMAAKRLAIRKALDQGINWFDTAEQYGTEGALGALLREAGADPNVSTKISLDPSAPDLAGHLEAKARAGLARLGRDQITVLQIHNRIDDAGGDGALTADQMLGPVLEGLERMRAAGATRFVGFTALGETATILKAIGSGRFDSVQVYYNLVNPSAARPMPPAWHGQSFTGIMDAARARQMGVLAIRILDGGIIATDNRAKPVSMMARDTSEAIEADRTAKVLALLGEGLGPRPQIGVRFALACPDVSIALVGIGDPAHVDAAVAASTMGPLPGDAIARLEPLYERDFASE
jgi:aryl-alcohol dehydrogenase-like predicted oxidoreductase